MANPDDIELKIKTTGDTTGADEVKESIFAVRDAAKDRSDAADVENTKAKQAVAVQEQQAKSLREIADAEHMVVAANLAEAVGTVSDRFRGMSDEMDLVIDATGNFLNVFASTGDPIKASMAVAVTAIEGVVTAYKKAEEQAERIAKNEQEDILRFAELRRNLAGQIRAENLTAFFQSELNVLDKQEAAMERIFKLRASERELAAAQQSAAGAAAVAGGASAEGAAAQNLAVGLQNSITALKDSLAEATAKTEKLEQDAVLLKGKADALVENTPEQIAALTAAEQAKATAEESRTALGDFATDTNVQIQTLITKASEAAEAISTAGQAAITQAAVNEKAALQAEVDRLGSSASSGAKEALATLTKILADGVIKPDELAKLGEAMARIRGSREAADKLVADGFDALQKADEAFVQQVQPLVSRLGQTLDAVQQIQGAQTTQDDQIREIFRTLENFQQQLLSTQSSR